MKCFPIFIKDKPKNKNRGTGSVFETKNLAKSQDYSDSSQTSKSFQSSKSIPELYKEKQQNLRVFSLEELSDATNGFNRTLKIGEGGFGSVYKGTIKPLGGRGHPLVVAIKKLNTHGLQGHKEWLAEVQFLGVVNHANLVKLLGYCCADGERGIQRLLVYEFMSNRSLEDHLFNKTSTLLWKTRLEIMLGAAQGLAYLHEGLEVKVIYRDFKSSNVLLDECFKPKLSDFGLAREGPTGDRTHVSTAVSRFISYSRTVRTLMCFVLIYGWFLFKVVGTYGYAAPEYIDTGHLTIQSDIWTFGVVLYEIITGRRTVERNRPTSEQKLLEWVKNFPPDSKRFSMIIDPRLQNDYSFSAAQKVGQLAKSCLNKNAKERPTMSQVAESLKQAIQESQEGSNGVKKSHVTSSSRSSRRRSK
ncbi:probable serine/threonine-protein kinase PBL19 isoform X1 [Gossypium arboreum]|uniref:probable serine/threonine-protein kinase PBL19 isoform X1 n=1 Tax=Gossypium arboreum TaxID=29729 RepID=UPI0022F14A11|nr:probable serine/threonine-protein kinase PBL19 isoform X1 [Gossypium arboreum]